MSLFDRVKAAARGAAKAAGVAGKAAAGAAMDSPRVKARVEQVNAALDEAKKAAQAQLEQVEAELWAWIKKMQAEAQKAQRQADRRLSSADHYRTLGLQRGASLDEVKTAYRKLMRTHHPDRFAHDPAAEARAHEKAQAINLAYQELTALLTGRESRRAN